MDKTLRGLIVALFGIATTLLTAAGLVYVELRYDFSIYGYVYAFVLPVGALFSGLVAASGYYLGAKLLSYHPGRAMMAAIVAISGGNFFFINWLEYVLLKVDGESIRSYISFPAYLVFVLTHTSVSVDLGTTVNDKAVALGAAGYLYAALLIAGFACGGWIVYAILRVAPYCDQCGLYMVKQGSQARYFVRREDLGACSAGFQAEAKQGRFRKAIELHGAAGSRQMDASSGYSLNVAFKHCRRCAGQWLELIGKQRVNKSWNRLSDIQYRAYCTEPIDAIETLAGPR
jgi:hypothetical protein